jgi:hypothetical protein
MSTRQQSTGCIDFPNPHRYLNLLGPSLLNSNSDKVVGAPRARYITRRLCKTSVGAISEQKNPSSDIKLLRSAV